jgi:hypothetical protein
MAFAPVFQRPFSATFDRRAAAAVPWWLSGGVAAANAVAVYQPKGAASLAASYDNIAAPGNGLADGTYDATPGVAPTFNASTGWTFNGSTQHMIAAVVVEETWTVLCQFSEFTDAQEKVLFGFERGGYSCNVWVEPCRSSGVRYSHGGQTTRSPKATLGNLGLAGNQPYRNGVADGGALAAWAGKNEFRPLYIGAWNYTGNAVWHAACKIQAVAIYNTTLTAPQVASISAAMAAL